jgi:hypothetical protein
LVLFFFLSQDIKKKNVRRHEIKALKKFGELKINKNERNKKGKKKNFNGR